MYQKIFPNSLSVMSFKEYMKIIGSKENILENGWGFIVDIDLLYEHAKNNNQNISSFIKYVPKYIPVISPIKEYPSIRSMKSMHNLMVEEEPINKYKMNNLFAFICVNIIGIITFPIIYYVMY